jgi:phosphocarrier protein HPr
MSDSPIVRRTVVVPDTDPLGLHMRPAQVLVQLALGRNCKIEIVRDTLRVDAKSIFDVLTLAGEPGVELVLEAQGDDAEDAIDELARYVESGFTDYELQSQKPAT